MKVILVAGVIGSGKDHFADEYIKSHPEEDVKVIRFAEPLREIIEDMYGVVGDLAYTQWKSVPANRKFMVDLAHAIKKSFGEDFFVRNLIEKYNLELAVWFPTTFIIPDFRFPYEITSLIRRTLLSDNWVSVVFCNFHSHRYEIREDQESERMAIWLKDKLNDGDTIIGGDFLKLISKYEGYV